MISKKCPYCGGTEFTEVDLIDKVKVENVNVGKDYWGMSKFERQTQIPCALLPYYFNDQCVEGHVYYQAYSNMHAEVCKKCGHIEFFADQELLDAIHKFDKEQQELDKAISVAKDYVLKTIERINSISDRINEVVELSKNDSISVKQYNDYLLEKDKKTNAYNQAIKELDNYIEKLDSTIKKEVSPLKNNIKK